MNRNKELFKENLDNLEKALEKSIRKNTPPQGTPNGMDGLLRILGVLKTQDRRCRMSVVILLVIVLFFLVLLAVSDTVTRATESSDVGIPLIAFSFVGLFISCALLMAWILSLDKLLVAKLSTFSPEQIRTFIDYMLDEGIEYEMAEAKNIRRRCGIIRSKPSRQETDKIDFV